MTELKTEGKHFISTFIKSVDWSEKWIWCIFAVLCAWFVMILVNRFARVSGIPNRESFYFQLFVFIIDSCIVFGGRTLNKLGGLILFIFMICSRYWKYFATRNYFDEDGLFFSFTPAVAYHVCPDGSSAFSLAFVVHSAVQHCQGQQ